MLRLEINEPIFTLPPFDYDVLRIELPSGSIATHERGQVAEVEVPAGGVGLRFMSSGGKEMQKPMFITMKQAVPPTPPAPAPTKAASMVLPVPAELPRVAASSPQDLAPSQPPKGNVLKITDSADATVEKKE